MFRSYLEIYFENHAVYEIMWKNICRARQASDNNMVHAHFCIESTFSVYIYIIPYTNFKTMHWMCELQYLWFHWWYFTL